MQIKTLIEEFNLTYQEAIEFFMSNDWFDSVPSMEGNEIILTDEQIELFRLKLSEYLSKTTAEELFEEIKIKVPDTAKVLKKFFSAAKVSSETKFYLLDFLLTYLKKDIVFYTNDDIEELLNTASSELIMTHIEVLTFFLSYVRTKRKTKYYKNYGISSKKNEDNGAYTFEEYIEILYHLFNEGYIEENEMYQKAARSKNYADTWLFLSIHFICSLRMTDLERIYHPRLPKDPQAVLDEIENGTFSDSDARSTLLSITDKLCILPLKPNKTKDVKNVPNIRFTVPDSCEVHMGKLFALCEAHQQVSGKTGPIIRKIASFEAISRNMGDDIGMLFLHRNFCCRKANKSFLQAIENLSQDVLGEDGPNVKGYVLAALARSHKASYGKFASTAATYLRDEALNGMTPEFVAFELFERGVLSFIPSLLLNMTTGGEYKKLEIPSQTKLVKELGLSPKEIEDVVSVVNTATRKAQKAIIQSIDEEIPLLEVLHNIGSGMAASKQHECLCLLTATYKVCPYEDRQCVGCDFEISTKSTIFLMANEYKRIANLYQTVNNEAEKKKFELFIKDIIIPKLEELLFEIKEIYGEKVYKDYEEVLKNYVE